MDLPPFLLDQWISRFDFASPPIACNLASSTGPRWTLGEVLALGGSGPDLADTPLGYAPAAGSRAVREAIAAFHGVDPDWVIVTTGASEALSLLFFMLERPGGDIVLPDPGYPAYAAMAAAWRLGASAYRLDRAEGYSQRAETVLAATTRNSVAAIVTTPHNPSGSVMERAEVVALAADLRARHVPVIVDEVYHPIYFGIPQPSAADVENVIVISDLSKALSLPGLRMGWIIDRDAERRRRLIDARSYFTISHSPLLERIAAHALTHASTIVGRAQRVADVNLAMLEAAIERSGGALSWVRPAGGTTTFPWFTDGRDIRSFCETAAARGVLVAPGDCFGHPDHVRLGIASQASGFDEGLATLMDLVAG